MNPNCPFSCLLFALGWLLGGSALMWATWNQVMSPLFGMKKATFFQAILFLATCAALYAPCYLAKRGCSTRGCALGSKYDCCCAGKGCPMPGCPYKLKGADPKTPESK